MAGKHKRIKVNNEPNELGSRRLFARRAGFSHSGSRDLYEVLGYPRRLDSDNMLDLYERGDIAAAIVDAYPDACWRVSPDVYEDDTENETAFEKALSELVESTHLWSYAERADRNAGLGPYSLLVLGLNDAIATDLPARRASKLLWLLPVVHANVDIAEWETDAKSPQFGKPKVYQVTTNNVGEGLGQGQTVTRFHYTRCIHIAERCIQDDVNGTPRLQQVWNRIEDIQKTVGGSAETFWLEARSGLVFQADDGAVIGDATKLKAEAEEYQHQLRRILTAQNGEWKKLAGTIADPRGTVDVALDMIAACTRIPKRILLGNEAGELASTTDETNWIARVEERRNRFVTPFIVRQLIDRLISLGLLPTPRDGYKVEFAKAEQSETVKATNALNRTNALTAYANSSAAQIIVKPEEFREEFLFMTPEPAGGFDDGEDDFQDGDAQGPNADPNDPEGIRGGNNTSF